MDYPKDSLTIKSWAVEDRPREKWMRSGRHHLSDAELLAILLGSGNRNESAVDLGRRILNGMNNDLDALGRASVQRLQQFPGIGQAKSITILAALELARRRKAVDLTTKPQIRSSQDAYQLLSINLEDLSHEEFWILLLNRANRVIGRECISTGGVSGTVVDAKIVFRKALEYQASSLILGHNHPSGNLAPSTADRQLTAKLIQAGKHLDIAVLDHLIVTNSSYYSFADEGDM